MPIVFSAVACDRNLVANFASCDGNFTEIAEQVLSKLPPCNNKMTYSHGIYLLHYISEDEYLYFCITDKLCQRSRAFLFLNEIQRRFIASVQSKEDFTTVLAAEMYRYSEDYNTIIIRKGELDELNSIGVGCSESILGEKILYINNPDNISYSTISHVSATPGLISVSVVSSTAEGVSLASPTSQRISVEGPTTEKISIENSIPGKITVMSPTSERISVESTTLERKPVENLSSEKVSVENLTTEKISVESPTPERISVASPTPESISVASPSPEKITVESTALEKISLVGPTSERISFENSTAESQLVVDPTTESISVVDSTPNQIHLENLSLGRISSENPTPERTPVVSPRFYVVIIGVIMLVIAMAVYAFGPISCVIVTSIGIYSLLRSYVDSKYKSD